MLWQEDVTRCIREMNEGSGRDHRSVLATLKEERHAVQHALQELLDRDVAVLRKNRDAMQRQAHPKS